MFAERNVIKVTGLNKKLFHKLLYNNIATSYIIMTPCYIKEIPTKVTNIKDPKINLDVKRK